jgi:hypothetical protein
MSTVNINSQCQTPVWLKKQLTRGEVPTELCNCNLTPLKFTDEYVLEAAAPNFFELHKPFRRNFTIL